MKVLIGIVIFCFAFAFVNCASVKETNEQILERITKECDDIWYGRYVDPFNCQRYYRCLQGVLVKKDCAVGLGYDPKSQECKPKVEGCSIKGIPKEIKETNEQTMQRITEECEDLRNRTKRFVDPFDCKHYYRCMAGRLGKQDCDSSRGLCFNAKVDPNYCTKQGCTPEVCSKK